MSGGHWNYLRNRLEERAAFAGDIWNLIGAIEHELDYGICGDTCYDCAGIRVLRALEAYLDTESADLPDTAIAIRLLRSSEPECERCRALKKQRVQGMHSE